MISRAKPSTSFTPAIKTIIIGRTLYKATHSIWITKSLKSDKSVTSSPSCGRIHLTMENDATTSKKVEGLWTWLFPSFAVHLHDRCHLVILIRDPAILSEFSGSTSHVSVSSLPGKVIRIFSTHQESIFRKIQVSIVIERDGKYVRNLPQLYRYIDQAIWRHRHPKSNFEPLLITARNRPGDERCLVFIVPRMAPREYRGFWKTAHIDFSERILQPN
ncbi:hypothetical protein FRC03_010660 [Tulasnella sp. 419]|nr:hypothetical protein FRC03_010660 [Tulasnella sp. 419]